MEKAQEPGAVDELRKETHSRQNLSVEHGEGSWPQSSPVAENPSTTDHCWKRENQFSLRVELLVSQPHFRGKTHS